jgi:hypothetical protein
MNGSFLNDLSSGIFSRLGELRQEQDSKDQERKLQTIGLLTSLADKVEPSSLPTLLHHLGTVVGVKGKLKGFWQALSGLPDRSVEDQLGTQLRDITGQLMGPQAASNIRAGGDMARLFQPTNPEQQFNQSRRLQAERDLSGKMIFRDPRAEKLEDLKTQYGLKFDQQESLLQQREDLLRRRQEENDQRDYQNSLKVNEQKAQLKAHGDVLKRASLLAFREGQKVPSPDHLQRAAEEISEEQGINLDLLKARIGLTQARTQKAITTPQRKAKLSPTAVQKVNSVKIQKGVEDFERTKQALIDATSRGDQPLMTSLRRRLQTMAANLATRYGNELEIGSGEWPYVKPKGQSPSQGRGDNEISMDELREVAKRRGISLEQARTMAQAEGLIVR